MKWTCYQNTKVLSCASHCFRLTPKGLNVCTADKPVLVNVTWAHTIFGFFETFVNMRLALSLAGKKNCIFWTYGSKVMGVWSFKEKSGQGGHVLEPTSKSWPLAQKVEGRKKKKFKKNGKCPTGAGVDPRPATSGRRTASNQRSPPTGRRPKANRGSTPVPVGLFTFFWNFFI
jgi:hypothetical protein